MTDHHLFVDGVNLRLGAGHEAGAEPDAGSSEHQCGGESSTVSDPTGGHYRNRSDRVDHGRDERHRADLSPDVSTGFPALCHDHIDPRVDRAPGFFSAADGVRHERARLVNQVDVRCGITPEERNRP